MPGAEALKKAATYADLRRVPNHLVAEILEGDLQSRSQGDSRDRFCFSGLPRPARARGRQPLVHQRDPGNDIFVQHAHLASHLVVRNHRIAPAMATAALP